MAEVRHFTSHSYEWIVEGDIKACFDEISHAALMDRVRARVGDKRVLALVNAFLKSGILGEDRAFRETSAGTPQGSILSPLLSNVALSVLDEHIARGPGGPASTFNDRQNAAAADCRTTGHSARGDVQEGQRHQHRQGRRGQEVGDKQNGHLRRSQRNAAGVREHALRHGDPLGPAGSRCDP